MENINNDLKIEIKLILCCSHWFQIRTSDLEYIELSFTALYMWIDHILHSILVVKTVSFSIAKPWFLSKIIIYNCCWVFIKVPQWQHCAVVHCSHLQSLNISHASKYCTEIFYKLYVFKKFILFILKLCSKNYIYMIRFHD